jgi:hypothetical protein
MLGTRHAVNGGKYTHICRELPVLVTFLQCATGIDPGIVEAVSDCLSTATIHLGGVSLHDILIVVVPFKKIHAPEEKHVRCIWERDVVLIRPGGHIAWRLSIADATVSQEQIAEILQQVCGR